MFVAVLPLPSFAQDVVKDELGEDTDKQPCNFVVAGPSFSKLSNTLMLHSLQSRNYFSRQ